MQLGDITLLGDDHPRRIDLFKGIDRIIRDMGNRPLGSIAVDIDAVEHFVSFDLRRCQMVVDRRNLLQRHFPFGSFDRQEADRLDIFGIFALEIETYELGIHRGKSGRQRDGLPFQRHLHRHLVGSDAVGHRFVDVDIHINFGKIFAPTFGDGCKPLDRFEGFNHLVSFFG